jgi:integrase
MKQIKPMNNNGSITIRFKIQGRIYRFTPLRGARYSDKIALGRATAIAAQIGLDISLGQFDPTLDKYRLQENGEGAAALRPKHKKLLDLWDEWVESLDLKAQTKSDHYEMVRRMITKSGDVRVEEASWLKPWRESIAPSTFNKRLGYLRSCLKWALNEGLFVGPNPYLAIKASPVVSDADRIKPFSLAEIKAILEGLESFYPAYLPFVQFLFATGCRTGEAIGLLWRHVDFENGYIEISESLSIDKAGNGYTRIRKSTKTGRSRYLPLQDSLKELLLAQKGESGPEDLVFSHPQKKHTPIDSGNFRVRIWKPLLFQLGIEYRNPYQTRHTLLTHAVMNPEIGLLGAAKIAGHTDARTVTRHYARFIGTPTLPKLF